MSNVPSQVIGLSGFREVISVEGTPVMQIDATNGIRDNVKIIASNATATEVDSNFVLTTAANAAATISLLSSRHAKYRAGQGITGRFSALFETSAADSLQIAGLFNDSQGFIFGYIGTVFGIGRFYNGQSEIQYLQVTTPAGGAENATVTVDGVGYTVPLTSGTVNHNAYEIAVSLNAQVPVYEFTSNQDTVTATDDQARPAGAFAFTSATAVATWTQVAAGATPTVEFVAQADWTNPPSWAFDPSKGNVFQIKVYWGYGGAQYYMGNPDTGEIELVHQGSYANEHTIPIVEVPTFRVGWAISHTGNTTPLTVKGSEASISVEGKIQTDERSRGLSAVDVALTSTNPINLISIRNRSEYDSNVNRTTIYPELLTIASEHNKPVIFYLQVNTTFFYDIIYSYVDEENSCMEYSFTGEEPALNGRSVGEFATRSTSPLQIDIGKVIQYLQPAETLTIAAKLDSGANGTGDVTIHWLEDL